MSLSFISDRARLWHVLNRIESGQLYLLYSAEHDGTIIGGEALRLYGKYMTREDRRTCVRVPINRDEALEIGRAVWTEKDIRVKYEDCSG